MSNDKFSTTSSSTRREERPSSSAPSLSSSTSSAAPVRAKPEKKQPVFGRPLVPYFLEESGSAVDGGELLINETLELPEKLQVLQKDLIVPNGNRDITVREFRDGYFEHKQLDLDNVLQSQHEVPNFVAGTSGTAKSRDIETFASLNGSAAPQLNKRASPAQRKKSEQMKHFDNYFNMVVKRQDPNALVNPVLAEAGLDSNGAIHHENGSSNGFPKPPRTNNNAKSSQQSTSTPQRKSKRSSPAESTFKRERTSPTQFRMSPISSPSIATPEARIEVPKLITPQYILATAKKNSHSAPSASLPSPFIGTYKVIEEGSSSDEYSDEDMLPNNGYKTPSPPDTARQLTYTPVRPEGAEPFHSHASPFHPHLPPTYQTNSRHLPLSMLPPPPVPESSPVVPYQHVASEMTETQLLESLQQLSAPSSSTTIKPNPLKKVVASASHHAGGAWSNSPPASSLPIIPESWRRRMQ